MKENIRFALVMLTGIDCVLSAKVCMMTGEMMYWWLSVVCLFGMIYGIKLKEES